MNVFWSSVLSIFVIGYILQDHKVFALHVFSRADVDNYIQITALEVLNLVDERVELFTLCFPQMQRYLLYELVVSHRKDERLKGSDILKTIHLKATRLQEVIVDLNELREESLC